MATNSAAVVLFSGGRDSTASAVVLGRSTDDLHLLSFKSGFAIDDLRLRELRQQEMLSANLPSNLHFRVIDIRALVREVVLVNIVDDIQIDGCQLVLLGEALCMFCSSIVYARRHGIGQIAYGAVSYQSHFPEQQPSVVEVIRELLSRWKITLLTPGMNWKSDNLPKQILRDVGLSTKSLESVSMFADIDDSSHSEEAAAYIERKMSILERYIERSL